MSELRKIYEDRVAKSIASIKNLDTLRAEDVMVDFVFLIGKELFETPLDKMSGDLLVSKGGKLAGAFAYLGQKTSKVRAERDIYEQKLDELYNEKVVEGYADADEKITLAKSMAKRDVAELKELVIMKEYEKNNYESIANACQTLIFFIQSALRTKEGERFISSRNWNI